MKERDSLSSPLEHILKRLDAIEQRLSRLEASSAPSSAAPQASNAAAFAQHAAAAATPGEQVAPAAVHPAPPKVAVGSEPKSYSATATAPSTERLHPLSTERGGIDAPFPDLSQLDEKVDPRKGPAQHIDVAAAIEDYPRICKRIEQLWGSPECEGYINNLVIDTRGNRKGFPPAVMEELLYLGRLARALVILSIDGDLWDTFDQVGDRR